MIKRVGKRTNSRTNPATQKRLIITKLKKKIAYARKRTITRENPRRTSLKENQRGLSWTSLRAGGREQRTRMIRMKLRMFLRVGGHLLTVLRL